MSNTVSGHSASKSSGGAILVQFNGNLNTADAESFSLELHKLAAKYKLKTLKASFMTKTPASFKRAKKK